MAGDYKGGMFPLKGHRRGGRGYKHVYMSICNSRDRGQTQLSYWTGARSQLGGLGAGKGWVEVEKLGKSVEEA